MSKYSHNGDSMVLETMRASIQACTEPFTSQELAKSISTAHSDDDGLKRLGLSALKQMVELHMRGSFGNPVTTKYICKRLPDGRYVRLESSINGK